MRKLMTAAVVLSLVAVYSNVNAEKGEKKDPLAGIKCPVSGKPVVADKTADYKGGKVYFCCPGCPGGFAKNTAKFAAKANHQLVATGQAKQVKCPIAGRKINPAKSVTVAGVKVGLCCPGCEGKAKKAEGDAQLNLVFSDAAFKKGFKVAAKKK